MLYVNGIKVEKVLQGATIKETLEESLNYATVRYISDRAEGFDMYTPAHLDLGRLIVLEDIPQVLPIKLTYANTNDTVSDFFAIDYTVLSADSTNRTINIFIDSLSWTIENNQSANPDVMTVQLSFGEYSQDIEERILIWSEGELVLGAPTPNTWYYSTLINNTYTIKISIDDWNSYINTNKIVHYLVAEDNSALISRFPKIEHSHTLTLIEPTKYLERITLSPQSFTNTKDFLVTQIRKALTNAEVVRTLDTPRFKLSKELESFLAFTPGEDFIFSTPTTLRDVLDEMLSVKNARAKVDKILNFNNIEIGFVDLSVEGSKHIDLNNTMDIRSSENLEYQTQNLEVYGENAVLRKLIHHGWDTFKPAHGATITTSNNVAIVANFPIEEITRFVLRCKYEHSTFDINGAETIHEEVGSVDIVENILDSEIYMISDPAIQDRSISYVRGEQEIDTTSKAATWYRIEASKLNNAIKYNLESKQGKQKVNVKSAITEMLYQMSYVPFYDVHAKVSKDDFNSTSYRTTQYYNQNERSLSIKRFGNHIKRVAERTGCRNHNYVEMHYNILELYALGSSIDGHVISTREYMIYDNSVKAFYTLTKNYVPLSERISINREKRIYNIPLKSTKTDTVYKEYIVVDSVNFDPTAPKLFSKDCLRGVLSVITNSPGVIVGHEAIPTIQQYAPIIDTAIVETYSKNSMYGPYKLDVASYNFASSFQFQFKFRDNASAGLTSGRKVTGGKEVVQNPYVDAFGEFDKISIKLTTSYVTYKSLEHPEGVTDPYSFEETLEYSKLLPLLHSRLLNVKPTIAQIELKRYKDAANADSYSLQLETIVRNKNIILTKNFYENNLINGVVLGKTIKLYESSFRYKTHDTRLHAGSVEKGSISISYNYTNRAVVSISGISDIAVSWALADSSGNLFVACNDVSIKQIYFILASSLI